MKPAPRRPLCGHTITSFRDAVGVALELADDYAFANAVLLIDLDQGRVIDATCATSINSSLTPLLRWSWQACRADEYQQQLRSEGLAVLLLAVRETALRPVSEVDLASYRFAKTALSVCNASLLDWIHTDGDALRSFAYLTSRHTAWSNDSIAHRSEDERWLHEADS